MHVLRWNCLFDDIFLRVVESILIFRMSLESISHLLIIYFGIDIFAIPISLLLLI